MSGRKLGPGSHGFLNLDKPSGITSRAAVDAIVRLVGRSTRVGHAGTLDPLASGVLVVALGAATRLIEYVGRMPKVYQATARLGATSDTDDADGAVVPVADAPIPSEAAIRAALDRQVGTILQVPPQFSALKREGRRAYDLARQGQSVELAARPVRVDRIEVLAYQWPNVTFEVTCGGGTYIRSIARDLGAALGCGGLIASLRRTRIGPFDVRSALDPDAIRLDTLSEHLQPSAAALEELPRAELAEIDRVRLVQGQAIDWPTPEAIGEIALFDANGDVVGIGNADGHRLRPTRIVGPQGDGR